MLQKHLHTADCRTFSYLSLRAAIVGSLNKQFVGVCGLSVQRRYSQQHPILQHMTGPQGQPARLVSTPPPPSYRAVLLMLDSQMWACRVMMLPDVFYLVVDLVDALRASPQQNMREQQSVPHLPEAEKWVWSDEGQGDLSVGAEVSICGYNGEDFPRRFRCVASLSDLQGVGDAGELRRVVIVVQDGDLQLRRGA